MPSFGLFETFKEIPGKGDESVYHARRAGEADAVFVVRVKRPAAVLELDQDEIDRRIEAFLDQATTQAAAARAGTQGLAESAGADAQDAIAPASHWVEVIEQARTAPDEAYVVTAHWTTTLEKIPGRRFNGKELRHIVAGVLDGLDELRRACDRPHGQIDVENVHLSTTSPIEEARVALSHPLPTQRLGQDRGPLADLAGLAGVIFRLITGKRYSRADMGYPIQRTAAWASLGAESGAWVDFCNRLFHPTEAKDLSIAQARSLVPAARTGGKRLKIAISLVAVVLVAAGVGGYLLRPGAGPVERRVLALDDAIRLAVPAAAAGEGAAGADVVKEVEAQVVRMGKPNELSSLLEVMAFQWLNEAGRTVVPDTAEEYLRNAWEPLRSAQKQTGLSAKDAAGGGDAKKVETWVLAATAYRLALERWPVRVEAQELATRLKSRKWEQASAQLQQGAIAVCPPPPQDETVGTKLDLKGGLVRFTALKAAAGAAQAAEKDWAGVEEARKAMLGAWGAKHPSLKAMLEGAWSGDLSAARGGGDATQTLAKAAASALAQANGLRACLDGGSGGKVAWGRLPAQGLGSNPEAWTTGLAGYEAMDRPVRGDEKIKVITDDVAKGLKELQGVGHADAGTLAEESRLLAKALDDADRGPEGRSPWIRLDVEGQGPLAAAKGEQTKRWSELREKIQKKLKPTPAEVADWIASVERDGKELEVEPTLGGRFVTLVAPELAKARSESDKASLMRRDFDVAQERVKALVTALRSGLDAPKATKDANAELAAAAAAQWRQQVELNVKSAQTATEIDAGVQKARQMVEQWAQRVGALDVLVASLRRRLDALYLPEEKDPAVDAGQSLNDLDRQIDPTYATGYAALASRIDVARSRLKALREMASAAARQKALEALQGAGASPELVRAAWLRLEEGPGAAWPSGVADLDVEAAAQARMRKLVGGLDAGRKTALLREADGVALRRWRKAFAAVCGSAGAGVADVLAIDAKRGTFGLSEELYTPGERYLKLLVDVRGRIDKAKGDDAALQKAIADGIASANRLAASAPEPIKGQLIALGRALDDAVNKEQGPDPNEVGPAKVGWKRSDPTPELMKFEKEGKTLVFRMIPPEREGAKPAYLLTTELPVGVFVDVANGGDAIKAALAQVRGGSNSPAAWSFNRETRTAGLQNQWLAREGAKGLAADELPTPNHPAQRVSVTAARLTAAALNCRLPTEGEWRTAVKIGGRGQPHLPTAKYLRQLNDSKQEGTGSALDVPPSPALNTMFEKEAPGPGEGTFAEGPLFFREVTPGSDSFQHLVGNVMEYVAERVEEKAGETASAKAWVVGGSCLSPEQYAKEPYPAKPVEETARAWSDVGFRLAFDEPKPSLLAKVNKVLKPLIDVDLRLGPEAKAIVAK